MERSRFLDPSGPEPSATRVLAEPLRGPRGVIQGISSVNEKPDTPNEFAHIGASIASTIPLSSDGAEGEQAGGIALSESKAQCKAIGEAIERYCLSIFDKSTLPLGTAQEKADRRVSPERFNKFTEPLESAPYYWTEVLDLQSGHHVEIPAQLVYFPFVSYDQIIRNPITTGAATHTNYRAATRAAVLEIIERDAYIISYLNELQNPRLGEEWTERGDIGSIIKVFREYNFDPELVYLTLDAPVHIILCILKDKQFGTYEFGLSASFTFKKAITDALLESYHTHAWMRDLTPNPIAKKDIHSLEDRAQYWLAKDDTSGINHWLTEDAPQLADPVDGANDIDSLLEWFREQNMSVYLADVSTSDTLDQHFKTVRAVIPEMHPLYLSESYRYTGGERLLEAPVAAGLRSSQRIRSELNEIPHPFL